MNAEQVIQSIHRAQLTGKKVGLENTYKLIKRLNIEPSDIPSIHVAGTNGKGSVCAMLESALRAAGKKTGLYTSPFLQLYNERFAINGHSIDDDMLAYYGEKVLKEGETLQATSFELGTALALLLFKSEKVDMAVMEVGLGGRLDPTNVIMPRLSVITAIGMDHMRILGNSLPEIAYEKAGIIKTDVPVVVQGGEEAVLSVFRRQAELMNAPLIKAQDIPYRVCSMDRYGSVLEVGQDTYAIGLPGEHQHKNALTAIAALKQLGLSEASIQAGLGRAQWPGRLEWCGNILIDGAHNAQGTAALRRYVEGQLPNCHRTVIFGMLDEKLSEEVLRDIQAIGDEILTVPIKNPKALDAQMLAARFGNAAAAQSLQEALSTAREKASLHEKGCIIVAGSLYLVGEVRSLLSLEPR